MFVRPIDGKYKTTRFCRCDSLMKQTGFAQEEWIGIKPVRHSMCVLLHCPNCSLIKIYKNLIKAYG